MAKGEIKIVSTTRDGGKAGGQDGRIRSTSITSEVTRATTRLGCLAAIDALEAMANHLKPQVK